MTETVPALLDELAGLGDPKMLAVNQRHGDEHSVNLTKLRAVAKRVKTNQPLALELWETENTNARLLALLVCKPKEFTQEQLDTMLRDARTPKVQDWLVNYVVKKSNHKENLREVWFADADPVVASAGWALTTERVIKSPDGIDLVGLLDLIESDMKDAQSRLQWAMNETLATIGIYHEDLRARALDIGERLEVLKDYPTPPNCTSPFAPIWINAIVARR
jgi:3-methyladenine DNA glycosylase AlkD